MAVTGPFLLDRSHHERRTGRSQGRVYRNDGRMFLTQNRLKAIGVTSTDTQAKAKQKIVDLGLWDVVETGCLFNPTVFRPSDRWRKYPNVPPQADGKRIADRKYANCSLEDPNHPINRRREEQVRIRKSNAGSIQ